MTLNKLCQQADLDGTGELSRIVRVSPQTLINRFNSKGTKNDRYKSVIVHIIGASEIKRMAKMSNLFLMRNEVK